MIFVQVRRSGPRIESGRFATPTRQKHRPFFPGSGWAIGQALRGDDFRPGSQIGVTDRIRPFCYPNTPETPSVLFPGSGLVIGSRGRARDFRPGSQIGVTDRIRDTFVTPICGRQPAGGPSSGHSRSGWRSWTERSVLTRDPIANPDPTGDRSPVPPAPSVHPFPGSRGRRVSGPSSSRSGS